VTGRHRSPGSYNEKFFPKTMQSPPGLPYLRELILFLALAGVVIPLLQRLRVSQVLGFLVLGTIVGPFGLGRLGTEHQWLAYFTITSTEPVRALAEFGVIFLLFLIGLELSTDRLWSLRRWVFVGGGLQVVVSAAIIAPIAWIFGNSWEVSLVLGIVLAFSSTAIVMQTLAEHRELASPVGRSSFAVLLFQDLAVVPLLVLIAIAGDSEGRSFLDLLGIAFSKAALGVGGILLAGRFLLRPLFHQVSRLRQADAFVAFTLLAIIGTAAISWSAGLSMALGAFLAGLLLADTEYRHEIEITIEPFKGLLMGLFFMSVGMGIDVHAFLLNPIWIIASVLGLLAIKGFVVGLLFSLLGLSRRQAVEGALLLGQGGEFAFIIVGTGMIQGFVPEAVGHFMLLVVGISMLLTPFFAQAGRAIGRRMGRHDEHRMSPAAAENELRSMSGHVIIAGFGRVGQLLGQVLDSQKVPFVAIDNDSRLVTKFRSDGVPVYFGDASRAEILRKLGAERAEALVVTLDHPQAAGHAVRAVRREFPELPIFVRARDERHALALKGDGATIAIPETLEASLQLAGYVLERLGMPDDVLSRLIQEQNDRHLRAQRRREA